MTKTSFFKFQASLLMSLILIAISLPALSKTANITHGKPEIIAVSGIIPGKRLIVHIIEVVPPGSNRSEVAANALARRGARPFTHNEFTTIDLEWDQFSDNNPGNDFVTQNYNPNDEPTNAGLDALRNTHDTWNNVATSIFAFDYDTTTVRCPSLVDECSGNQFFDGHNDVAWLSLNSQTTLGVTWSGIGVDEADMALNTDLIWSTDGVTGFDVETVFLHENGHALGLGHSTDVTAIMSSNYSSVNRDLQADDIDGITSLYPVTSVGDAPIVSIINPTNGSIYNAGDTISFAATATDTEDGSISDNINWSSNIIGAQIAINTASFSIALVEGTHTITASVTDTAGNTANDSISLTVVGLVSESIDLTGTRTNRGRSVTLRWNTPTPNATAEIDVYANGGIIGSTANDGSVNVRVNKRRSYTFEICEAGSRVVCSNSLDL